MRGLLVQRGATVALLSACLVSLATAQSGRSALVREEQLIMVGGAPETWRLVWKAKPQPACDPAGGNWMSCPCSGFAFGEAGQLDIVRLRDGKEVDRLPLNPLFEADLPEYSGKAVVQRWAVTKQDTESGETGLNAASVQKRPPVKLMTFGDYDHDGHATEFFLQTTTSPCSKRLGVMIGISQENGRLHAFPAGQHSAKPLVLSKQAWDSLLKSAKPPEIIEVPCGDHGAEAETAVQLSAVAGRIEGRERTYSCPGAGAGPRKRLNEKPLE